MRRRRKRGGRYVESLRFDDDKFDELMMMVDHSINQTKGDPQPPSRCHIVSLLSEARRDFFPFLLFCSIGSATDALRVGTFLLPGPPPTRPTETDLIPRAGR